MWRAYASLVELEESETVYRPWAFSDDASEADELAALVLQGRKRATAPSVWELGSQLPRVGNYYVVVDASGAAQCVIRTTGLDIVPFDKVTPEFAAREGEGDGSLAHWRSVHWPYYERILEPLGMTPEPSMPIACHRFEKVYP